MSMFKTILCDDDEIILEGMKGFITENFPDIELNAVAVDGKSCRMHIEKYKPDILITDIRLPDCLGFELIKYAQQVNENTSIIIISGYDDFTYAQKALRAGALDYITKPIDLDEFTRIINTAKERCSQNSQKQLQDCRMFLTDILDLKLTDAEEIQKNCQGLNLVYDTCYSVSIIELDVDNPKFKQLNFQDQQNIYTSFSEIAEQKSPDCFFLLRHSLHQYIYLVHADTPTQLESTISDCYQSLQQSLSGNAAFSITLAYGRTIKALTGLHKSYKDAISALNYKFIIGSNSCISYKDVGTLIDTALPDIENLNFAKLGELSINNKEELDQKLSEIRIRLSPLGKFSHSYARVLLEQLIFSISSEVNQYGISLADIFSSPVEKMQTILDSSDLIIMLGQFRSFFLTIAAYVESNQHNKYAKTIYKALKYIEDNLNRPDLNVNSVARHVYLSSGYFSLIFKNQTSETFSDYLIRQRILKAKDLILNTDLKFYEISYMVGYENVSHFNVIFKKNTGLTPSQSRRQQI